MFCKKEKKICYYHLSKGNKKKTTLNDIGALKAHNQILKGYTIYIGNLNLIRIFKRALITNMNVKL